ncbi:hypothetical protein [Albirhodobacter sp. R86504]|uniref:hypothetical protein n=1 Tax=Albirhodobacter sp. R86504 TaxID=3093848 RepID=UPI0036716B0F
MHSDIARAAKWPTTARDRNSTEALAEVDALRTALLAMLSAAPRALRLIVAQDLAEAEARDRETPQLRARADAAGALREGIEALR